MRSFRRLRRLARVAGIGLMVAAISQEMSKPEAERTWQGKVMGIVPYDFRPPTWDRFRQAYWNPTDERLFSDRPFGVGWALNFYRARTLLEQAFGSLMGNDEPEPEPVRKAAPKPKND